jgi:hypothetical protein
MPNSFFKPSELVSLAVILDEAAAIIRSLPQETLDKLEVRYFLCDELEGAAIMAREAAAELKP